MRIAGSRRTSGATSRHAQLPLIAALVLCSQAFHGNVGTKTTLRVINHARSRDACCSQRRFPQDLPDKANVKNYDFLLWCVAAPRP